MISYDNPSHPLDNASPPFKKALHPFANAHRGHFDGGISGPKRPEDVRLAPEAAETDGGCDDRVDEEESRQYGSDEPALFVKVAQDHFRRISSSGLRCYVDQNLSYI